MAKFGLKKYLKLRVVLHWGVIAAVVIFVMQEVVKVPEAFACPPGLMCVPINIMQVMSYAFLPVFVAIAVVDIVLEGVLGI